MYGPPKVTPDNVDSTYLQLISTKQPKLVMDVDDFCTDIMENHMRMTPCLGGLLSKLNQFIENTRVAYNRVIEERDEKLKQLTAAENRLAEVQRIVQRYTVVADPVVASDGFTYERKVIQQYLDECNMSKTSAYSQQTKEVLQDVLIPNQSLRKLVDLLRTVNPQEIPAPLPRRPIGPFTHQNSKNQNAWFEEATESEKRKKSAIHAADLEAAFSKLEVKKEPVKKTEKSSESRPTAAAVVAAAATAGSEKSSSTPAQASRSQTSQRSDPAPPSGVKLHPCIRVYGFCNFKDDCTFARYPYDACLNNIKGKCRFGSNCKELHVNPSDAKYQNPRTANARKRDD